MGTDQTYQFYGGARGEGRRRAIRQALLRAMFSLEAARYAHMRAAKVYPLRRPMLPVQARNKDPRIADAALRQLSDSVMCRMLGLNTDPLFGLGAWTGGSDA